MWKKRALKCRKMVNHKRQGRRPHHLMRRHACSRVNAISSETTLTLPLRLHEMLVSCRAYTRTADLCAHSRIPDLPGRPVRSDKRACSSPSWKTVETTWQPVCRNGQEHSGHEYGFCHANASRRAGAACCGMPPRKGQTASSVSHRSCIGSRVNGSFPWSGCRVTDRTSVMHRHYCGRGIPVRTTPFAV